MLGKTKNTNVSASAVAPKVETAPEITTILAPGAVIDGNLSAPGAVRLDGILNGNCTCEKDMVIGTKGQVKGNITAQNIVISGEVKGDIVIRGKLELFSTGKVVGNITARALVIDEDAYFDGRCSMSAPTQEPPLFDGHDSSDSHGEPPEEEKPKP